MGNFADLGNFQFVTVDEKGLIGSVYFERGRIRLVHKYGPCISDLQVCWRRKENGILTLSIYVYHVLSRMLEDLMQTERRQWPLPLRKCLSLKLWSFWIIPEKYC